MFDALAGLLRHHPEVTFFLVLGIGYAIGKVKLGSFTLGAVTGTLLAGVLVGQLRVQTALQIHLHGIDERTARPMRVVRLERHATTLQSIDPERPRSDQLARRTANRDRIPRIS